MFCSSSLSFFTGKIERETKLASEQMLSPFQAIVTHLVSVPQFFKAPLKLLINSSLKIKLEASKRNSWVLSFVLRMAQFFLFCKPRHPNPRLNSLIYVILCLIVIFNKDIAEANFAFYG
jgi:hypothetical protein